MARRSDHVDRGDADGDRVAGDRQQPRVAADDRYRRPGPPLRRSRDARRAWARVPRHRGLWWPGYALDYRRRDDRDPAPAWWHRAANAAAAQQPPGWPTRPARRAQRR